MVSTCIIQPGCDGPPFGRDACGQRARLRHPKTMFGSLAAVIYVHCGRGPIQHACSHHHGQVPTHCLEVQTGSHFGHPTSCESLDQISAFITDESLLGNHYYESDASLCTYIPFKHVVSFHVLYLYSYMTTAFGQFNNFLFSLLYLFSGFRISRHWLCSEGIYSG